jgi:hypothetical protein
VTGGPPHAPEGPRLLARIGSPVAVASLAAPLVLVTAAVAAGLLRPERAAAAWSVRIWAGALGLCAVANIAVAIRRRRLAWALALLALEAVLAQGLAWAAWRFDGTLNAGVGEPRAPWERKDAGPLARSPAVEVLDLPTAPGGSARLLFDGREVSLPLGRATEVGGGTFVAVQGPFPAPSFEVLGPDGVLVEKGLVKIAPGKREWFMVGFLPHRLYLRVAEGAPGADPRSPERLHLRVQRGKLRVLERDVASGERVTFERLSFAFGPGDLWARVEVHHAPPVWPGLALAAAIFAGALALGAAERRGAR